MSTCSTGPRSLRTISTSSCDIAYSSSPTALRARWRSRKVREAMSFPPVTVMTHCPRLLHQRTALPTRRHEAHKHDNIVVPSIEDVIDLLTPFLPRGVQVVDGFRKARCAAIRAALDAPIAPKNVVGVIERVDRLEVGRL